jgi:protein-S-isoprenylcysteine O-methyltransferase Ste14
MAETVDRPNVVIPPPIAWALAIVVGLGLGWLYPLPFIPAIIPHVWVGVVVFALAVALAVWAIVTIRRAGTQFDIRKPTTAIVENGPYGATRNPIYLGMFLGQTGIAIGFDNLWVLAMLAPFYFVIRDGVVAREEAYLERKFGTVYRGYKARVRRWL